MRRRKSLLIAAVLLALGGLAGVEYESSLTRHTCLECRATQTLRTYYGFSFEDVALEPSFAEFIAQTPGHQHQWRWCGSTQSSGLAGEFMTCGKRHPIWNLPAAAQAKYARLVSPAELQATLQEIDSPHRSRAEAAIIRIMELIKTAN